MFERQSPDGEFTGPVEFTGGHPLLLLHTLRSCANEDAEDDDDDDDDDDKDEDTGQVDRYKQIPRLSPSSSPTPTPDNI